MQMKATIPMQQALRRLPAVLALASAVAAASAASAAAEVPQIAPGARLAATCVACHGTNGATQGTTLPALAGQPRQTLADSLRAFKAGARQSTIMTQIARGYTDEQIEQLAAYFSAQKK
jgi:cytochrome c553